jgi:hypothetical protein
MVRLWNNPHQVRNNLHQVRNNPHQVRNNLHQGSYSKKDENTMAKSKRTKEQIMVYKIMHEKLKI